jgi:uncharacterized membrane-anchored protein YhcB (DUF1043 family)
MESEKLDQSRAAAFAQTRTFVAIVALIFGMNIGYAIANEVNRARMDSVNARLDVVKAQLDALRK